MEIARELQAIRGVDDGLPKDDPMVSKQFRDCSIHTRTSLGKRKKRKIKNHEIGDVIRTVALSISPDLLSVQSSERANRENAIFIY